jgi:Protein of unknown function (DUF4230)
MRRPMTFKGTVSAFTVAILLLVPAVLLCAGWRAPWLDRQGPPPPPIVTIRKMSELVTTGVRIATQLIGENRHYRGEWQAEGDAMLGIDLRKVSYARVNPDTRQAVLLLPKPHLIMWKVDHIRSKELGVDSRVWVPLSSKQRLRDEVWQVADRTIERLARDEPSYTKRAKIQAKLVLETLFAGTGWAVSCEWEEPAAKVAGAAVAAALPLSSPENGFHGSARSALSMTSEHGLTARSVHD